jgi:hypothetical protein
MKPYTTTIYIAMNKIEGETRVVGAFKTYTEAVIAARVSLDEYLEAHGFTYQVANDWLDKGFSPDGQFSHYAVTTLLSL